MLSEQIQRLLQKYKDGTLTASEQELLDKWYEEDAAFLNMNWEEPDRQAGHDIFSRINQQLDHDDHTREYSFVPDQSHWYNKPVFRLAAAVVIVLSIGWMLYMWNSNRIPSPIVYKELVNPIGKQARITLSDGSVVRLNADSRLKYPTTFSLSHREVYLQGEAFFEVKKDPDRPFIVHTSQLNTQVLGTSFNINAYPESGQQQVTVVTGKVAVSKGESSDSVEYQPILMATLTPNQQITYDIHNRKHTVKLVAHTTDVYGWTNGKLIFEQIPLNEAFQMIRRQYSIQIKIAGKIDNRCQITARFAPGAPLEEVLQTLKISSNITYTRKDSTIYIQGGDCM